MTSFAIYELIGFVVTLPLSYAMAYLARKYSRNSYREEVDRLFRAFWKGTPEDELRAWYRVRQVYVYKQTPKKLRYIEKKINELDKQALYSTIQINEQGELVRAED